jgi:Flp pilus assembly protein TadD
MVLNNYAYFLSVEGRDFERALIMSTRANQLSENNSTYLDTHAWILYKLGKYEEARNVQRKALMLDTTGSEALLMHYGDILYALDDKFMAETYWKKALEAGADPRLVEQRLSKLKETSDEK